METTAIEADQVDCAAPPDLGVEVEAPISNGDRDEQLLSEEEGEAHSTNSSKTPCCNWARFEGNRTAQGYNLVRKLWC